MKISAALVLLAATAASLSARIVTQPVAYEHQGVKLEGYLAYDDEKSSAARIPGVLLVPEWWGLNDYVKGRARQIAALGYVAFVADMYGGGFATNDPKQAGEHAGPFHGKPLLAERAQAGLDQLLRNAQVDPARVAAIGYCFGGTAVQELAYTGAPLAGIVSFHGSLVPATADAAAKNHAKFLICHGAADPFTKKETLDAFLKSLDDGKFDYQFIRYAHAQHAFTNPESDTFAAVGLTGIAYNAAADHRSWSHMTAFLTEIFRQQK